MSRLSAHFFGYVQDAGFYRDLHREAVALLPPGTGQTWFDIGCGPGLVARLAHERGYSSVGFDLDAEMIKLARRRSTRAAGPRYLESSLSDLVARHGRADVVSAASLLSVVPDRSAALNQLLGAVSPGGSLLVVETSQTMSSPPAGFRQRDFAQGRRAWVLGLWAQVRRGRTAVDVEALCPRGYHAHRQVLLGGLVNAWLVQPEADGDPAILVGAHRPAPNL